MGGRYSDEWHRVHLVNPRDVVPESNMPSFPWLEKREIDAAQLQSNMRGLTKVGVPYTPADIEAAPDAVDAKTELDAVVAYLQGLGNAAPKGG